MSLCLAMYIDMVGLAQIIEQHWKYQNKLLSVLLWPLARIFQIIAALRRSLYRYGWIKVYCLPCPVVVIGNIHVGGVGKTPLVAALVRSLQQKNIQVGIISRGYGRQSKDTIIIDDQTSVSAAGDEPLMLYRQLSVPVAVGKTRLAAGQALLRQYPELQIIISDDGLQHYALKRDLEIVIIPATDVGKRLDLLPNGPLREPLSRLQSTDGILFSQGNPSLMHNPVVQNLITDKWYGYSSLKYGHFYLFNQPQQRAMPSDFAGRNCAAIAAIGRPERFFQALQQLGIELSATVTLPDHATITIDDWPDADVVFITEKDAVKLAEPLNREVWILPLEAVIIPDLSGWIVQRLHLSSIVK